MMIRTHCIVLQIELCSCVLEGLYLADITVCQNRIQGMVKPIDVEQPVLDQNYLMAYIVARQCISY